MEIKGLFKNSPFSTQLFISFGIFILFNTIVSIPLLVSTRQDAGFVRLMLFINQVGSFILSSLFLAYLFSDNVLTYLKIKNKISWKVAVWIILSMIVVLPFLNLTIQINEAMNLPEWMKPIEDWMMKSEKDIKNITDSILISNGWSDLILNLVVVALTAAIGEELFFRGVLQNILGKKLHNKHVIICTVAILFSAIHLQFYGFIPRMLMGVYFGYLLYFTGSIWAPVLAHFTNNAFAVLITHKYQDAANLEELDAIGTTNQDWWIALISLALWCLLFWKIIRSSKTQEK